MRIRTLAPIVLLISISCALPIQAQYKEMARLDALSRNMPEPQMFSGMAEHFGVTVDTLKQEKSSNDMSYGQLFLLHAVAKASNSDVKSILLESKSKFWPEIAKEKNVDMKQLSDEEDALEKAIKKLQKSK